MTLTFIPQRSRSSLHQAERDAFELLYDQYGDSMRNVVFRKLVALGYSRERSRKLTEDLVQKIWTEVWTNRRSLKTATFDTFLSGEVKMHIFRQGPAEEHS